MEYQPCQPLREAVSWNATYPDKYIKYIMSASSWGCELKYYIERGIINGYSQPLREAVSWNMSNMKDIFEEVSSASSWGCELKCYGVFVNQDLRKSASLWGCELKYERIGELERKTAVSLFVRLWVEIVPNLTLALLICGQPLREAVSWNIKWEDEEPWSVGQLLREAVSWNFCKKCNRIYFFASFFIRLWIGRKQR